MHAPKARTCAYSGDRIEKGDIAITIASNQSSNNNEWIELTSIRPLVNDLKSIRDGEYTHASLGGNRISHLQDALGFRSGTPRGNCAFCGTYNIDGTGRKDMRDINPNIITFTFRNDNDPWVHEYCVDDLIDTFESVFDLDQLKKSDILLQWMS